MYGKYHTGIFSISLSIVVSVLNTNTMLSPNAGNKPPSNVVAG